MTIKRQGTRFEINCDDERQALQVYSALTPLIFDATRFLMDDPFLPGTLRALDSLGKEVLDSRSTLRRELESLASRNTQ